MLIDGTVDTAVPEFGSTNDLRLGWWLDDVVDVVIGETGVVAARTAGKVPPPVCCLIKLIEPVGLVMFERLLTESDRVAVDALFEPVPVEPSAEWFKVDFKPLACKALENGNV